MEPWRARPWRGWPAGRGWPRCLMALGALASLASAASIPQQPILSATTAGATAPHTLQPNSIPGCENEDPEASLRNGVDKTRDAIQLNSFLPAFDAGTDPAMISRKKNCTAGACTADEGVPGSWRRGRTDCVPPASYSVPVAGNGLNVLYMVAHDLRADTQTPTLQEFSEDPLTVNFPRAFSQAPFCSPSRHSFFTGRHPATTRSLTFKEDTVVTYDAYDPESGERIRAAGVKSNALEPQNCSLPPELAPGEDAKNQAGSSTWMAVPQAFVSAGYETVGSGITLGEYPFSLVECPTCWNGGYYDLHMRSDECGKILGHIDIEVASALGEWLELRSTREESEEMPTRPFFMMAGFWGGHVPYSIDGPDDGRQAVALNQTFLRRAEQTLDGNGRARRPLPLDDEDIRAVASLDVGAGSQLHDSNRLQHKYGNNDYKGGPMRRPPFGGTDPAYATCCGLKVSDESVAEAAYKLGERLSAFDVALGTLLGTVKRVGRWEDTIIVFHSDHGLSLGEFGHLYHKGKLLDVDTRVPLKIRAPLPPRPDDAGKARALGYWQRLRDLQHNSAKGTDLTGGEGGTAGLANEAAENGIELQKSAEPDMGEDDSESGSGAGAADSLWQAASGDGTFVKRAQASPHIVSLLDVYPTLCELTDIASFCPTASADPAASAAASGETDSYGTPPLDGIALLTNTCDEPPCYHKNLWSRSNAEGGKGEFATSVYPRCPDLADEYCKIYHLHQVQMVGTSIRSTRWRYTVWAKWNPQKWYPTLGEGYMPHLIAGEIELYRYDDHLYTGAGPHVNKTIGLADLAVEKYNLAVPPDHKKLELTYGLKTVMEVMHCRVKAVWWKTIECDDQGIDLL